jgi:glycosyltransferase involved in cell wall biosynthesis
MIVENEAVPYDRRVWLEARSLVDAGFAVSVICPAAGTHRKGRESLDGVEIYRYPSFKAKRKIGYLVEYTWALIAQFFLALRIYAKTRFKVLHACNPPDTAFLIALFFKLFGVRFVFDHHALAPELYALRFRPEGFLYRLARRAERLSFQTADLCIAPNDSFRDIAIELGGVRPERIAVVQTCAELRTIKETAPDFELKDGCRYMVVCAGAMESHDGLDLLLDSIQHVVHQWNRADVLFALLGDGSELRRLHSIVTSRGLDGNVHFTGRIPHEEVCVYLATADICVAPDPLNQLNDNSSMIKVFEYMAFGKPIVLYDLKEGRRTADGAALFACPNDPFDFAQQIVKLLDNPTLRTELGKRGRRRVIDTLNWESEQRKLVAAYESLCGIEHAPDAPSHHDDHEASERDTRLRESSSLQQM